MSKISTRLLYVALIAALVASGATGAAVAKGKIKGKQIAANAIATKHLKAGAVTGDKLADGSVTTAKVAAGSVTGAKLAADTITGAQVDEATLGQVPDAAAIAGRSVAPIAIDLPNTQASAVTVATGPGWTLGLDCDTTVTKVRLENAGTTSLVTTEQLVNGQSPAFLKVPGGTTATFNGTIMDFRMVSVTGGSATVEVQVFGTFDAGHFGSQKDCYFRGAVTTTP